MAGKQEVKKKHEQVDREGRQVRLEGEMRDRKEREQGGEEDRR